MPASRWTQSRIPRARTRRDETVARAVGDEWVVYDLGAHRVHALNASTMDVFRALAEEAEAPDLIATMAEKWQLEPSVAEPLVGCAAALLATNELLERPLPQAPSPPTTSRRHLLRLGVAASLVPVLQSILVPEPAHAQSLVCPPGMICCRQNSTGEIRCRPFCPNGWSPC